MYNGCWRGILCVLEVVEVMRHVLVVVVDSIPYVL